MTKKIVGYVLIFVAGLYTVRELLYMGIRSNEKGIYEKYNTVFLQENDHDVLFLGSSRVETHFDPAVFDSISGHNSYNIGVTGATPRIAFGVLKAYCSKSSLPKYIVYDVDLHFLKQGVDTIHFFPRYFPYLSNSVLLKQFSQIDKRFTSFRYNAFHSLPYSNLRLLSASLHGWLDLPGKYDTCWYKGFQRTVFFDSLVPTQARSQYSWFHPTERKYLDSIIQFSKQNGIDVVLCTSPMYQGGREEILNKKQITSQVKAIAAVNHISYIDLSDVSFSNERNCFADRYHMNYKGAVLFSQEFSKWFLQYSRRKPVN